LASDPSLQPLTYSLSATASFPDALSWLAIAAGTGQLRLVRAGLDFEDASVPATFTVLVTVSNGVLTGSALVTVTVLDVHEPAVCTFPTGTTFVVPENSAGVALARVSCSGVDAATTLQFSVWQVWWVWWEWALHFALVLCCVVLCCVVLCCVVLCCVVLCCVVLCCVVCVAPLVASHVAFHAQPL
jgi:hypothetical protein